MLDDPSFRRDLDELLRRAPAPDLYDLLWSFVEGRVTRRELMVHPAFGPAWAALQDERYAAYESQGVDFLALQRALRERVEARDEADDTFTVRALR